MMATHISRDPFARTTLERETVNTKLATCTWCGGQRKNGGLFRYITATDSGRRWNRYGFFCSKSCHDSYHL